MAMAMGLTTTTHPEFNANTEGLEVAKVFSEGIRGKTVVIAGVNRKGIGFATAEAFASQSPAHIIMTGRTVFKLQESIDALKEKYPTVNYRPLIINLSDQRSVRAAAEELLSWSDIPSVNILVNSAGISMLPDRVINSDGIELTFATNHVGHFLFSCLIMPKLIKAAQENPRGSTRIVNVSSGSPRWAVMRWSDMNFEQKNKDLPDLEQPNYSLLKAWGYVDPEKKSYIPLEAYNVSKVANLLFSIGVNKRLYEKCGILSLALHPGVIHTELIRSSVAPEVRAALDNLWETGVYSYRSLGAGASTSLVAALDPKLGPGELSDGKENFGTMLYDCQIWDQVNAQASSSSEAEKLWDLSEKLVKERFEW